MKHRIRRALLQTLSLAASSAPRVQPEFDRHRILLIRPDHLGDLLMATAVIRALRAARPRADIVALVGPWSAPVLRGNPHLDAVLSYSYPWFDRAPLPSIPERFAAAAALGTRIRALGFDEAIVLRTDHWWGALAAAFGGVPRRVGYALPECAPFLTEGHPPPPPEHVVRTGLRLIAGDKAARQARAGAPATCFEPSDDDRARARRLLLDVGIAAPRRRPRAYVLLHPGASSAVKRWPAERWANVVDHLAARGLPTLLAAGPGEQDEVASIAAAARQPPMRLAHAPSIGVLGALLAGARLALGVDSAPMHLATAVGTPTIRLYGPGDETLFGPWGEPRRHRALRAPGTSPDADWFGTTGGPHPTMLALGLEQVLEEVDELLDALSWRLR